MGFDNKEFFDYMRTTGVLDKCNQDHIKELESCRIDLERYFLKLRKYSNDIDKVVNLLYWLNRNNNESIESILDEVYEMIKLHSKYFGIEESKRYMTDFERLIIMNIYEKDVDRMLKEFRIVVNPRRIIMDNEWYFVDKGQILLHKGEIKEVHIMNLDNGSDKYIDNINVLVCNDNKVNIIKYPNRFDIDPFKITKELMNRGLKYDFIALAYKNKNKGSSLLADKLDELFGARDLMDL